jgi:hypothetical protein
MGDGLDSKEVSTARTEFPREHSVTRTILVSKFITRQLVSNIHNEEKINHMFIKLLYYNPLNYMCKKNSVEVSPT